MTLPVSVIMTVLNEEAHIEKSLGSVTWATEVICIDTGSTDTTVALAQKFPNVKLYQRPWEGYAKTKQNALELATCPWVLWLDGDEEVSPELQDAIGEFTRTHKPQFACSMPRKNYVLGQWIRFGGWYPDRVLRLFPRELSSFGQEALHEKIHLNPGVTVLKLNGPLLHHTYTTWGQYYQKMVRYAYLGALDLHKKKRKSILLKLIAYPPYFFIRSYVLKGGFRDGKLGLLLALGTGMSVLMRYSYAYLLQNYEEPPP